MDIQELFAIARAPDDIVPHAEDLKHIHSQPIRDMLQRLRYQDSEPTDSKCSDILAAIRRRNQNGTI
jgi:hypothetical protein